MWLAELTKAGARSYPHRVALRDRQRSVTFRQLDERSAALAAALRSHGVTPGARVAVVSPNSVEVLETYCALARLGAVFVPLNPNGHPESTLALAKSARAVMIMGESGTLERLGAASAGLPVLAMDGSAFAKATSGPAPEGLPDVEPSQLAAIFHTSATTGTPKAVGISHRHLCLAALGLLARTPVSDGSVVVVCNPLYHGSMFLSLALLSQGATLVLLNSFTPQSCLAAVQRERATHLWLVPDMLRFLLQARGLGTSNTSTLREVVYAGAPMSVDTLRLAQDRLSCGFRQVYGMTEALLITCLTPEEHDFSAGQLSARTLSVGRPVPGLAVEVRDESDRPLPPFVAGQLCVRGDAVMEGYLGSSGENDEVMARNWLQTGDRAYIDDLGYVHLDGRLKDVIIRGGQKVVPLEVERVLELHPRVAEAAVVGMPDPDWSESPVAFVVARPGMRIDPDEILRFCVGRIEDFKRPVAAHVVSGLPRNATGKLLRRQLTGRTS
jgi:acyl-CoA synthetase (AMP-forming)/AMP-acid ligase II